MPHIKLEHTKDLELTEIESIFIELINTLVESINIKQQNCKCKSIHIPIAPKINHFSHVEISILKGRSNSIKKKIGEKMLMILKKSNEKNNKHEQFSIEIRDINPKHYFTSNTL